MEPWIERLLDSPSPRLLREAVDSLELHGDLSPQQEPDEGAHAELYSYCLYHDVLRKLEEDGPFEPLKLSHYHSVVGTDEEPYIRLDFVHRDRHLWFWVEFRKATSIQERRSALEHTSPKCGRSLCAQRPWYW